MSTCNLAKIFACSMCDGFVAWALNCAPQWFLWPSSLSYISSTGKTRNFKADLDSVQRRWSGDFLCVARWHFPATAIFYAYRHYYRHASPVADTLQRKMPVSALFTVMRDHQVQFPRASMTNGRYGWRHALPRQPQPWRRNHRPLPDVIGNLFSLSLPPPPDCTASEAGWPLAGRLTGGPVRPPRV